MDKLTLSTKEETARVAMHDARIAIQNGLVRGLIWLEAWTAVRRYMFSDREHRAFYLEGFKVTAGFALALRRFGRPPWWRKLKRLVWKPKPIALTPRPRPAPELVLADVPTGCSTTTSYLPLGVYTLTGGTPQEQEQVEVIGYLADNRSVIRFLKESA